MWKKVLWSLRIRRIEYRVAELPIFLIPIFLVSSDPTFFGGLVFWESLVLFLLLFAFGDLLNCLSDRDLDAVYKPHLTEAIDGLGVRGVWMQAVISALIAVGLSAHLSVWLERWFLTPMVLIGLLLAYSYSIEPIRLKGRGLWQLGFYWLGLFTAPMGMSIYIFSSEWNFLAVAVALAYGWMQTGVILVNTAEDFPEDLAMSVRTIVVVLGLKKAVFLSFLMTTFGGALLGVVLAVELIDVGGSMWIWIALFPFGLAWAFALSKMTLLVRRVSDATEQDALSAMREAAKWVPLWITSLAISTMFAAMCVFWVRVWHHS